MRKVIDDFSVYEYRVLILDEDSKELSRKAKIGERVYDVTIPYDIPNAIAIISDETFIGEVVEFIDDKSVSIKL